MAVIQMHGRHQITTISLLTHAARVQDALVLLVLTMQQLGPLSNFSTTAFKLGTPHFLFTLFIQVVTTNSDRICDAHNFYLQCPTGGCDGTHCENMVISISGRVQNNGEECICTASATTGSSIIGTIDVFSSECKDLDDETRFNTIWEA